MTRSLVTSAAIGSASREGFERVLSSVALGEVGIVTSREVSRLSRTDKDWCRLLEVCQLFETLIGDEQQVYDLSQLDDQLVLGIKGTLSVVELKVLRQRLQEGQESKARRGELFKRLPVGYVLDATGKVVLHPDRRVHQAIQLVFTKFRELWSVRQTFLSFRDHDVELPANPIRGTQLVWKIPSQSLVADIPRNPFYAGALVDRRPSQELLNVISPLGIEASLKAIEELGAGETAQRATLSSKLEQLQYEANKAFEHPIDPPPAGGLRMAGHRRLPVYH